jgi:oxalate---CoA ligase
VGTGGADGAAGGFAPGTIPAAVRGDGGAPALVEPDTGTVLSYDELLARVTGLAARLAAQGLAPGDCVAYAARNGADFVVTFLAAAAAGLASAPLNPAYNEVEFAAYLADLRPDALLVPAGDEQPAFLAAGSAAGIRRLAVDPAGHRGTDLDTGLAGPESVALVLHTSGTTSRPKGVPLSQGNLTASVASIAASYRLSPGDVSYCVMPMFHVHGLVASTLATLATGGTVVAPRRFSGQAFWEHVDRWDATWYSAVPTIHRVLLARAEQGERPPAHRLRFARSCSATLPPTDWRRLEDLLGVPVVEAYGMTEASHQMATNPLPPGERRPGTVGRATAGLQVAVVDESWATQPPGGQGEVVVRGPSVIRAYRGNPEANTTSFRDGWFRTGDHGTLSPDGYLTLLGRIKEMINRGGEKISPYEVEAALQTHPAVAEAVAFGAPDAKYGECVRAVVVLRGEATPDELRGHCADRLAAFKVPERVDVLPEIPKGPTGKVQRRLLSAQVGS